MFPVHNSGVGLLGGKVFSGGNGIVISSETRLSPGRVKTSQKRERGFERAIDHSSIHGP